jgi:hypothetical protein
VGDAPERSPRLRDRQLTVLFLWGVLSDERMGLSFVYAAGPCQRSLSRIRVPWDSRPYFTVSGLRLPFSSPPTTRRVTVEVFDPTSTRIYFSLWILLTYIDMARTRLTENTSRNLYPASPLARWLDPRKTRHVIAIEPVHWRAGWTYNKHVTWSLSTVVVWRHCACANWTNTKKTPLLYFWLCVAGVD